MGWGDEIMSAACANAEREKWGGTDRVYVLDRNGKPRWHPLFEHYKQIIAHPSSRDGEFSITNGPGARPYIDHDLMKIDFRAAFGDQEFTTKTGLPWRYSDWSVNKAGPAPNVFGNAESWPDAILIEPHNKHDASPNKSWGWNKWQALADILAFDFKIFQVGLVGTKTLDGALLVNTPSFVDAINVIAGVSLAVLPEGGLHHASACVGTPAVVLFGHMLDPANTGYSAHVNLSADEPACGERIPCHDCLKWWRELTPECVANEVMQCLKRS